MAIKNTLLGGTDWADGNVAYAADMNDTMNAMVTKTATITPTNTSILNATPSNTYVDVTNGSITITGLIAARTYFITGFHSGTLQADDSGSGTVQLLINGVSSCSHSISATSSLEGVGVPVTLAGCASVTGSTSYVIKVQIKTSSATDGDVTWTVKGPLFAMAFCTG